MLFGVVACGAAPSYPADPDARPRSDSHALSEFVEQCQQNVDSWQRGQALYPEKLSVELDESVSYIAGIDVSGGSQLRERLPDDVSYSDVPLEVRCGLGARLVSTTSAAEVDKSDWLLQEFDETGKLQWAWTVTGKKPGDHTLRLELRPAVAVVGGGYVLPAGDSPASQVVMLETDLQVTSTFLQNVYLWWDTNWDKIALIAAGLGGAVLAVRRFLKNLRDGSEDTSAQDG
ncbi:hypothetical protein [Pseudonocardia alaniniphila]|uniref:Lipoprotein n=1 Tax=Pseudonocardia alaniniphila TaxID=75291 RepID=A0ABS9TQT7_9PSEU|nr:hypothetical protein [Pseudonocardia alaniniphila]MCH6170907.1 hypothetical protein [Pseudonocardia alaniniphila]